MKLTVATLVLLTLVPKSAMAEVSHEIPPGSRLEIYASHAPISIVGIDGRVMEIQSTQATITQRGGVVIARIEARGPDGVSIRIPDRIDLHVENQLEDVEIKGIHGSVTVRNDHGPIRVEDVTGPVDVQTRLDTVTVENVEGDVRAESYHQEVRLKNVRGEIRARTVTAGVVVEDAITERLSMQSINGIVEYTGIIPADARFEMGTHTGEILIRTADDSNATIHINGNPQGATAKGASLEVTGSETAQVVIGDGRGRVDTSTVLGAVRVSVR